MYPDDEAASARGAPCGSEQRSKAAASGRISRRADSPATATVPVSMPMCTYERDDRSIDMRVSGSWL
jgi:hypothetical protein